MKANEWKALAAFGLLLGGLAMYDAKFAMQVAGIATVVVVVANADKIPVFGKKVKA